MYGSVLEAERTFERLRDVNFYQPELDRRLLLLAALAASGSRGAHAVLDIGGSTGFHREQLTRYLPEDSTLDWAVVETAAICEAAREQPDLKVRHCSSVEVALAQGFRPTCVYANSSLQYLSSPAEVLATVSTSPSVRAIVVERTPFLATGRTVTVSQRVVDAAGAESHAQMSLMRRDEADSLLARAGFETAWICEHRAAWRLGWQWIDTWSLIAHRPKGDL